MKTINELEKLWEEFGDIPVNDKDEIEKEFLHFPIGTDRFEIWHWFEDKNKNFVVTNNMLQANI